MRRSRFELYVDILEAIAVHGPLKVSWLTLKAKVNYAQLKPILNVLLEETLVEEKMHKGGGVAFSATLSGRAVLLEYKRFEGFNSGVVSGEIMESMVMVQ